MITSLKVSALYKFANKYVRCRILWTHDNIQIISECPATRQVHPAMLQTFLSFFKHKPTLYLKLCYLCTLPHP